MIGAIAGDILGSTYEILNTKRKDFTLFRPLSRYTDDTVLTIATADCILHDGNFMEYYRKYCISNQMRGYGSKFYLWALFNGKEPYNSMGNGSAMRVSPIGYIAKSVDEVLYFAEKSASATHNHPEGIKGAQAVALAIYLAKQNSSKEEIKYFIESKLGYDLSMSYDDLKKSYKGGGTCPLTVPQAIICFLDSTDFEDSIRNAIALGGDSDTLACITGSIAEAYYKKIPAEIIEKTINKLPTKFIATIHEFSEKYIPEQIYHNYEQAIKKRG
ncbi:hypothetical protein CVD28_01815 [Bacillus sp. M6-12]|uniref:ADP-ribosylglycohydrolase family protein n=1 Tax=Bacillus sp. M6-12 TaxID=2054166 RepID=UPI000C794CC4|nr:ADP-ribosylglycohydrolase family protein [Bacillus sp. M6-12]PLS19168.1 hypothetical protein CVD28_01815 [Bacillus sp. M6-12]